LSIAAYPLEMGYFKLLSLDSGSHVIGSMCAAAVSLNSIRSFSLYRCENVLPPVGMLTIISLSGSLVLLAHGGRLIGSTCTNSGGIRKISVGLSVKPEGYFGSA